MKNVVDNVKLLSDLHHHEVFPVLDQCSQLIVEASASLPRDARADFLKNLKNDLLQQLSEIPSETVEK